MAFDPHHPQQRRLAEALAADASLQAYVLLNPLPQDLRSALELDDELYDAHVLDLRRQDIPREHYPRLVPIHPHATEIIHATLAHALDEQRPSSAESTQGFGIGGWLTSAAKPAVLMDYLSLCMSQILRGDGRKYFRWSDRRIFEWMWPVLDAPARTALLGPVASWWTLDRRGALQEHTAAPWEPSIKPLRLSAAHWWHAHLCEPVQDMLRGWQAFADPLPQGYLPHAAQAVHAAHSLGITAEADIVLIGAYVLQIHPRLCEHPRLRELVRGARERQQPLAETLAGVADDGWNAMRDDLVRADRPTTEPNRDPYHG
jgi:hypothetical protein